MERLSSMTTVVVAESDPVTVNDFIKEGTREDHCDVNDALNYTSEDNGTGENENAIDNEQSESNAGAIDSGILQRPDTALLQRPAIIHTTPSSNDLRALLLQHATSGSIPKVGVLTETLLKSQRHIVQGGLNLLSEEENLAREMRASRFQVPLRPPPNRPLPSERHDSLKKKMPDNLVNRLGSVWKWADERTDIRDFKPSIARKEVLLTAQRRDDCLTVWGVDKMTTKDIMDYFFRCGKVYVEWLNDSTCNVKFRDAAIAASALLSHEMGDGGDDKMMPTCGNDKNDKHECIDNFNNEEINEMIPDDRQIHENNSNADDINDNIGTTDKDDNINDNNNINNSNATSTIINEQEEQELSDHNMCIPWVKCTPSVSSSTALWMRPTTIEDVKPGMRSGTMELLYESGRYNRKRRREVTRIQDDLPDDEVQRRQIRVN